jgi:hypothetical protein
MDELPVPRDLWLKTHSHNAKLQQKVLADFGEKIACLFPELRGKVEFHLVNGVCKGYSIVANAHKKRE